jgi:hypothetical protein
MDDENKQNGQGDQEAGGGESTRQHVHIFGAEVNGGSSAGNQATSGPQPNETKEDWRKRKDEWKAQHRAQRDEWRARRHEWRGDHDHGAGVVALLYTMGFVSPEFWHVISPLWPLFFIVLGSSLILGRHWFARFILFIIVLIVLVIIILYGLVKTDSPLVSYLSPNVVSAIQNTQAR